MKNIKNNIKQGLSFFQAMALVLILLGIFFALCVVCYKKNVKPTQTTQAIVVTEDAVYNSDNHFDSQDLIGDFILHHEYFTADAEVLQEEAEITKFEEASEDETEEFAEEIKEPQIAEGSDNLSVPTVIKDKVTDSDKENETPETIEKETSEVLPVTEKETEPVTPLISVVIDDMGINQKRTLDIISIKAPLTSSFLTYGKNLKYLAEQAKQSGHEIMVHAPMEPKVDASLAPDTLNTSMDKEEIEKMFLEMLEKFEDIEVNGINNHMGSKFTEDKERLGYIMNILKTRNMFFLDSKTTSLSKGKELALEGNVNFVSRDVFLDNENNYDYIFSQLLKAEKIALKKGYAIAICHPKSSTYPALKDWVETLKDKNLQLVHVSEIIKKINQ